MRSVSTRALKGAATATAALAERSGVVDVLERAAEPPRAVRILMYHRVAEPESAPELYPGLLSATPAAFERQLELLALRYNPISASDVVAARRGARPLPSRAAWITFDDAYEDFAEHAWPLLRRYGLPVTLFVPTGFPDQPERRFWWDRLYSALAGASGVHLLDSPVGPLDLSTPLAATASFRRLRAHVKSLPHDEGMACVERIAGALAPARPVRSRVLGWSALQQLAREGVELAPHSVNHPMLDRLDPERARCEIRDSVRELEKRIEAVPPVFAYPAGGVGPHTPAVLAREGIEIGLTTQRGVADLERDDPLRLPRIPVGMRCTEALLRLQLLPRMWSAAERLR